MKCNLSVRYHALEQIYYNLWKKKKVYDVCLTLTHMGIFEACIGFNFVINFKQLNSVGCGVCCYLLFPFFFIFPAENFHFLVSSSKCCLLCCLSPSYFKEDPAEV